MYQRKNYGNTTKQNDIEFGNVKSLTVNLIYCCLKFDKIKVSKNMFSLLLLVCVLQKLIINWLELSIVF